MLTQFLKFRAIFLNGAIIIQVPETTIITNIPAPNNDPIASLATLGSSFVKEATAEKISGAPFPIATRI